MICHNAPSADAHYVLSSSTFEFAPPQLAEGRTETLQRDAFTGQDIDDRHVPNEVVTGHPAGKIEVTFSVLAPRGFGISQAGFLG